MPAKRIAHGACVRTSSTCKPFTAPARASWCAAWSAGRSGLIWPDLTGARLLGIGYAVPFLGAARRGGRAGLRRHAAGPGRGCRWPAERPNQVVLAADDELPLADRSIDRVLMVHALESAEQSQRLLREIWRVLADGGQALIVVPNRRGLWCLSESTPFGHGRPFSSAQLKQALRSNLFTPRRTARALFVPPSRSRLMLRTAHGLGADRAALGQAPSRACC